MKLYLNYLILLFISLVVLLLPISITTGSKPLASEKAVGSGQVDLLNFDDSWYKWNRDLNHNKLDDLLDEKVTNAKKESVNVYINYYTPPTKSDLKKLQDLNLNISYQAKYINTICVREVPLELLGQVQRLPNIAMIELQPFLVPSLDVSAAAIKARGSTEYSPETAWELGYTGQNQVIAILDTGVDDRHESLKNKYVAGYDCTVSVAPERNPDDEDGHGTHCAGIAVGTGGEEGQYRGIAPNARLVDVKVLNDWGLSPGDQIIRGIEWCIETKDEHGINILSISIGEIFTGDDNGLGTQGRLVNTAADEGLVVMVAAGNDGPNNNGFSSLAAADGAITVGAIDEQESANRKDDEIADFSNRGPRADDGDEDEVDEYKPDVVTPGVGIMSALFSTTPLGAVTGYQQLTGTSMACPHAAGVAALMLEAKPDLTPEQIKQILHETSEARGIPYHSKNDPKYSKDYGWGIVDAYEAVRKAIGEDYQLVNVISHEMFDEVHNIVEISGTASVSNGRIQSIEYKIDDYTWKMGEGDEDWSFKWDTTTVENGLHYVFIRSFDGIEYSNPIELPLRVVNIGCVLINPINGSKVDDTITIKGTSFGENVIEVLVKIGNEPWVQVEPEEDGGNLSKWVYSWDTEDYGNGKYTISVKAYNGNWYSIPIIIEVIVDNADSSSGFLSGFDWGLMLTAILLILVIIYTNRIRYH